MPFVEAVHSQFAMRSIKRNTRHNGHHKYAWLPWSEAEDDKLWELRAQSKTWQEIVKFFPGKSDNACRKRWERLRDLRRHQVFEHGERFTAVATAYAKVRQEMWTMMAEEMCCPDKDWETFERLVCFEESFCLQLMTNAMKMFSVGIKHIINEWNSVKREHKRGNESPSL
jgi:Myb-like DNA-binding domain